MYKFKKGQLVECIDKGEKGSGWRDGYRFYISKITTQGNIYWPGVGGNGVYESSLRACEWDAESNYRGDQ